MKKLLFFLLLSLSLHAYERDAIHARAEQYTYALVLGSLEKTMLKRLDFLYQEWKRGVRFEHIVLLSGDRNLDPVREAFPEELEYESQLFVYLIEHHPLKDLAPYTLVNAPKRVLPSGFVRRPNTATTVEEWLKENPPLGSCLVISNQPYVEYQESVVRHFLPEGFSVECIGPQGGRAIP